MTLHDSVSDLLFRSGLLSSDPYIYICRRSVFTSRAHSVQCVGTPQCSQHRSFRIRISVSSAILFFLSWHQHNGPPVHSSVDNSVSSGSDLHLHSAVLDGKTEQAVIVKTPVWLSSLPRKLLTPSTMNYSFNWNCPTGIVPQNLARYWYRHIIKADPCAQFTHITLTVQWSMQTRRFVQLDR